jgi:signal transduction histidine kinase
MNILSNAIDALEESLVSARWSLDASNSDFAKTPTITIRTQLTASGWIQICIADNGPGMTEEVRRRLFDPFFTTKPVGSGTGLGLSISYQIVVDKHGGSLTCISAPGQGAEFVIEIPLQQAMSRMGTSGCLRVDVS